MSQLPADYSYSEDHEWINAPADDVAGKTVRVGITSVAADRLGEVVFAELPAVGDAVTAGESCGEVESTKSVSDLYSPVTGTVTAINEAIGEDYSLINSDPFGEGWLWEVEVTEAGDLMSAEHYSAANGV
ncbi:glycine cleavage system protein GcvH [Corynebacterium flavescens]|uniref:Glycine cleavage system H protein n=1 Tax=Corynebacterium flavescens TaxID=28028 RepID=A0A1L7CN11_CORFL|nr:MULTISPECIES: glycine cleavage system protein GcvH [Corynebacterium]APT87230.1 glycine cleavage system protein H [Corynebacterium flavescens]KAA8721465.1 glycine cleavage system protein GcvH [Corynebacterium flavescens]MDN6100185.1 glycine cleavage system protein GcvH [Corynebacterium flavescens]MDN6199451.1 glycine cleavage system protein GcvH [Corynebacterium flavescens]MDN6225735.1 glycine cleavage system protein GcvH [Corynebacterium flavescens]